MDNKFDEATRRVVVAMIVADDEIATSEVDRSIEIVRRVTGVLMTRDEIIAHAEKARAGETSVDDALRTLAPRLNDHDKELLIRVAVDIAATDGHLRTGEIELVHRIAENLGMTPDDLRGIIAPGG